MRQRSGQIDNAVSEYSSVRATGHLLQFTSSQAGYFTAVGHLWQWVHYKGDKYSHCSTYLDTSLLVMRMIKEDLTAHWPDTTERRQWQGEEKVKGMHAVKQRKRHVSTKHFGIVPLV